MGQARHVKTATMKYLVLWNVSMRDHIAKSENNPETSNKLGFPKLKKNVHFN